jgi:RNA polymerase sigma-70 factor, ECF subfamily
MAPQQITKLLAQVQEGDEGAQSRLASLVYDELHRIAAAYMCHEQPTQTLQATVLVHDAFLRLVNEADRTWQNRTHFYAVAAYHMRLMLVDHARGRKAAKRGGCMPKMQLDEVIVACDEDWEALYDIDKALHRLAEFDSRLAKVVELRFFAGMTEEEIGEVIDLSERQVKREWQVAKRWLAAELSSYHDDDPHAVGAG